MNRLLDWIRKPWATNPPPLDFLTEAEFEELEEDLPALASVIRAHQAQIVRLDQRMASTTRRRVVGLVGIVLLVAWMFRYEPMPMPQSNGSGTVLLDRWSGNLLVTSSDGVAWVDIQSFETKSRK